MTTLSSIHIFMERVLLHISRYTSCRNGVILRRLVFEQSFLF